MRQLYRNPKAKKRSTEKRDKHDAIKNGKRMPDGSRAKRKENVVGERHNRRVVRRLINRRDRRAANMQMHKARFERNIEVTGRPFINMTTASAHITS